MSPSEQQGLLLDVRDLQVRIPLSRGTVRAVDGARSTSSAARRWAWSGESGCGKSMTLRAILGCCRGRPPSPAGRCCATARTWPPPAPRGCATAAARASP